MSRFVRASKYRYVEISQIRSHPSQNPPSATSSVNQARRSTVSITPRSLPAPGTPIWSLHPQYVTLSSNSSSHRLIVISVTSVSTGLRLVVVLSPSFHFHRRSVRARTTYLQSSPISSHSLVPTPRPFSTPHGRLPTTPSSHPPPRMAPPSFGKFPMASLMAGTRMLGNPMTWIRSPGSTSVQRRSVRCCGTQLQPTSSRPHPATTSSSYGILLIRRALAPP